MQYRVIFDITASGLAGKIQQSLNAGWDLHGSIAIAFIGEAIGFAQAITNEDDDVDLTEPPIDERLLGELLTDLLKAAETKREAQPNAEILPNQDSQPE